MKSSFKKLSLIFTIVIVAISLIGSDAICKKSKAEVKAEVEPETMIEETTEVESKAEVEPMIEVKTEVEEAIEAKEKTATEVEPVVEVEKKTKAKKKTRAEIKAETEKEKETPTIDSAEINSAVQNILASDDSYDYSKVAVATEDGVTTLTGTVDLLPARWRAVRLTSIIEGVTSVVDQIQIKDNTKKDRHTFVGIDLFLDMYSAVGFGETDVGFLKDTAYLSGIVDSHGMKMLLEEMIGMIHGVSAIDNKIDVVYKNSPSDSAIKNNIIATFAMDPFLRASQIEVEATGGNVVLKGAVASAAEKSFAIHDAWVGGVKSVDANELHVKWHIKEELSKTAAQPKVDDKTIADNIVKMISMDPRTAGQGITVKSTSGKVYLGGAANNLYSKIAATEVASRAYGAWKIVNRMRVKPATKIEDNALASILTSILEAGPLIDVKDLMIAVRGGKAHIYGKVKNEFIVKSANDMAAMIDGVDALNNELEASEKKKSKSDDAIKTSVMKMLRWNALIDETAITVEVDKGKATVSGEVDNLAKVGLIAADAFRAGASEVRSEIRIRGIEADAGETFKEVIYTFE